MTRLPARFLQYRLTMNVGGRRANGRKQTAVQIAYLPKNIAPEVRQIEIAPGKLSGIRLVYLLERTLTASGSPSTLSLPPSGKSETSLLQLPRLRMG